MQGKSLNFVYSSVELGVFTGGQEDSVLLCMINATLYNHYTSVCNMDVALHILFNKSFYRNYLEFG